MNSLMSKRPISVVVGRIAVRFLILVAILWGAINAYRLFKEHQRSNEIAPIHNFADQILSELRNEDFFGAQEKLIPSIQRKVSVDWISNFAKNSELNATNGSSWGEWRKTKDANATIYILDGNISYTTGKKNPMKWRIRLEGQQIGVVDLKLGRRSLTSTPKSPF